MTVKKQFAQDGADLEVCMDQLVEVLAQLLDEAFDDGRSGQCDPETIADSKPCAELDK